MQPIRVEGQPAVQTVTQLISGLTKLKQLRDGRILFPGLKPNTFCSPAIFVNGKKSSVGSVSEISMLIDPDDAHWRRGLHSTERDPVHLRSTGRPSLPCVGYLDQGRRPPLPSRRGPKPAFLRPTNS